MRNPLWYPWKAGTYLGGFFFAIRTWIVCAIRGHERDEPWNPFMCKRCLRDPEQWQTKDEC